MELSSTTASSRRLFSEQANKLRFHNKFKYDELFVHSSFGEDYKSKLKPNERIELNKREIEVLKGEVSNKINSSYLFVDGPQEENDQFHELLLGFFREMRGVKKLAFAASYSFATYVSSRLSPLFQLVFAVLATFTF